MKRFFLKIVIVTFVVLLTTGIAFASFFNFFNILKGFGGKIITAKATEIKALEESGWECNVPGSSITIRPVRSSYPTDYIIPNDVESRTDTIPTKDQAIIGLYYPLKKTTVTCTKPCPPPPGNECTTTVTLDTIRMYGTSEK